MSAYLMGQVETLNIATAIKALRHGAHELEGVSAGDLAVAMFRLNALSVNLRYQGRATETKEAFEAQDEQPTALSTPELIEQLGCWLYQSCEEGCDKNPLYVEIELIVGRLARSRLRQYEENRMHGTPIRDAA